MDNSAEKEFNPASFDLRAGVPKIEGELKPKPKAADRISRRVLWVAFGFLALMIVLFLYGLDQIDNKPVKPADNAVKKDGKGKAEIAKAPEDVTGPQNLRGSVVKAVEPIAPASMTPADIEAEAKRLLDKVGAGSKKDGRQSESVVPPMTGTIPAGAVQGGVPPPLTPEQQAKLLAQKERDDRLKQARVNGLVGKPFNDGSETGATNNMGSAVSAVKAMIDQAGKDGLMGGGMAMGGQPQSRAEEQDQKIEFLKKSGKEEHNYHPHMPLAAISENEIKVGSFIPLILQQGINSDLPGQITARVAESIYDTISGCRLTTAIGKYDSKIALGQSRVLVVWNALVFPDGSELNLAGMQSYDMNGMAGFESEVDNHYLRMFGVGIGMSLVSAVPLTVVQPAPQTAGTTQAPSYAQNVTTALAQQFGQLGGQLMGKYAAVQPTLKNYPGEKFQIMVPRTMVFKKVWRNRCQ
jgi:type IV secretory pathway VirB10-like protein